MTEQDIYGGYGQPHQQPGSFGPGRASFSGAPPYPDAVQNNRAMFQDPSSYRPVTPIEAVQPGSGPVRRVQEDASQSGGDEVERLRGMLSQVTAELGKQVSTHHGDFRGGDAARAEWLQKLVLQMEAKQVLADAELRDTRSKFSGLQLKLQGQEAENDALRENLSRAHRGQPQMEPAPSEEHSHMMMALKRENKACRSQIDDMTQRNEILQRSVQHFEKQQHSMLGESSNLVLRLQGSEQRTDQLINQKSALDDELHGLRSQIAAQQKQWGKSEREYKDQLQAMQQQRAQESQRAGEELKNLHMQLALQQEQFEKQRTLMAQQRDGVQKGFEEELSDAMDKQTKSLLKNQELEAKIFQVNLLKHGRWRLPTTLQLWHCHHFPTSCLTLGYARAVHQRPCRGHYAPRGCLRRGCPRDPGQTAGCRGRATDDESRARGNPEKLALHKRYGDLSRQCAGSEVERPGRCREREPAVPGSLGRVLASCSEAVVEISRLHEVGS